MKRRTPTDHTSLPEDPSTGKPRADFVRLHLGSNSIFLSLFLLVCVAIAFKLEVFNWKYLKGLDENLSFFVGFFSIVFGIGFFSFWKFGESSSYAVHLAKSEQLPRDANVIYTGSDLSFAVSYKSRIKPMELPSFFKALFCVGIFFTMSLITLDNVGFKQIIKFPSEILPSKSEYCPEKQDEVETTAPELGCELIIRAYKLGYAKDLGACEPKKTSPENMKICHKRRSDEPYLHYMSRLLVSSIDKKVEFFKENKFKEIEKKFDLQLEKLKSLRDYETYAISAAPRASHHIWTNLTYPDNIIIEKYREYLSPNYCIEKFQNQTNTVTVATDDERLNSKLLEHVYGQLLFNPKSEINVGYCKEYKIHWNAASDTCDRLANNPRVVLQEEGIFPEVELVLKRHDIVNDIMSLDEEIQKLEKNAHNMPPSKNEAAESKKEELPASKKRKNVIVKSKIAKDKRHIRKKNEIVSFQCFMQQEKPDSKNSTRTLTLDGSKFSVATHYFPVLKNNGEAQISMYNNFSNMLEKRFHYSRLTSRSDINVELERSNTADEMNFLEQPSYLLSRLEVLKNLDIFLGNSWVLERDDLLEVYPYHVHLQNYVNSFRQTYADGHGRL